MGPTRAFRSLVDAAVERWMRGRVRVHLAGVDAAIEPSFPVVLAANHESWWDGLLLRDVQKAIRPSAPFRAVMPEPELRGHPLLRLMGGVGFVPGSVDSGRRLLAALGHLRTREPDAVLTYFPQGTFRPGSPFPLGFRAGVVRIVEALAPATLIPVGIRILPGSSHRAEAFVSVGSPVAAPGPGSVRLAALETAVADELDAIAAFLRRHGEDAHDRWPRDGEALPRASTPPPLLHEVGSWISRN